MTGTSYEVAVLAAAAHLGRHGCCVVGRRPAVMAEQLVFQRADETWTYRVHTGPCSPGGK